jgi:hypothetical protein
MPDPKDILVWVIGVPVVVALLAVLLSHLPWRRDRATQPWGPALAVGGAFVAAYIALRGRPKMPPLDAQGWLVWLGVASVVVAVFATVLRKRQRWVAPAVSVLLIAATVWVISRTRIPLLGWRQFLVQTLLIALALVAWWLLTDRLATRLTGPTLPLVLMLTASVAALALVNAHSLLLGQLAGASASACGVMWVSGFVFRKQSLARGGVLALTVVLLGVILAGHYFADLSMLDLILLAAAPLGAWVGEAPVFRSKRPRFAARLVAVLIILAIPLVPALKGLRETMQEQTDSYTY